ncbi:MAG: hypothetical protein M0Z49_16740 [Chloroflexi bacterium]|nr:hypothetical protein [Chloroflexota bacterium]MDA8237706.1 hypothetical protein [Chloroflexota bacterium]
MLRFIAVHPVVFSEQQLQPLTTEQLPQGVTWHSTFCAFADDKSFCHWNAPTKQTLLDLFAKYEIPYEAVYEVRLFDPAIGRLEPQPSADSVAQAV